MTDMKSALQRKKALVEEHFVPADDDQANALALAEQKLALARITNDKKLDEIIAEVEEVKQRVRDEGTSFVIRGVGRVRFEGLQREHPPTDAQRKENQATFDPEGFYPALFAESIDGGLTPEEWQVSFFDNPEWGPGEIDTVRQKVMLINTGTRVAELGN